MAEMNLGNLGTMAVILVVVVITIGLGAKITNEIKNTVSGNTFSQVINQSVTPLAGINLDVGHDYIDSTSFVVVNATTPYQVLSLNNFSTVAYDAGVLVLKAASQFNNTALYLRYNYTQFGANQTSEIASDGLTTFNTFASNMSTVALLAVAVLILGVLSMLGNQR